MVKLGLRARQGGARAVIVTVDAGAGGEQQVDRCQPPGPQPYVDLIWATPEMTTGHLLLAVVTTTWILISIQLEERDLIKMLGEAYVEYRTRVPALILFTKRGG